NSQQFIADFSGDYAVIISQYGCEDTSSCYNVSCMTINNIEDYNYMIYPNPTDQYIFIDELRIKKIEIVDSSNRLVSTILGGEEKTKVDLGNYSKGVYIFKIYTLNSINISRVILY
ncbi:MAG: T9SS type A sorting domain-containing protein, partial [Bacteroidota bacterium]